ncbi:SDR family NAD(P)-dependent oxidoreductase, partial [uncultured Sphingomonas sp.]|uniref:SDR family NAD(P)-dependent oxidoreductase n=1 Tax=uncultured Sphingomonas sp. TaxID=158754 RepID=UPI0037492AE1
MPLALVTGGARRLGAHIAARLVEAGYDLAVQSRSGDAPEKLLTERLGARRLEMFVADLDDAQVVSGLPG